MWGDILRGLNYLDWAWVLCSKHTWTAQTEPKRIHQKILTSTKPSVLYTRYNDSVLVLALLHSLGNVARLELVRVKLRQILKRNWFKICTAQFRLPRPLEARDPQTWLSFQAQTPSLLLQAPPTITDFYHCPNMCGLCVEGRAIGGSSPPLTRGRRQYLCPLVLAPPPRRPPWCPQRPPHPSCPWPHPSWLLELT